MTKTISIFAIIRTIMMIIIVAFRNRLVPAICQYPRSTIGITVSGIGLLAGKFGIIVKG
jgi:hypothetical protein